MKKVSKFFLLLIVISLLLISGSVQAKEYLISNYDINLKLTEDGNYLITEQITYDFQQGSFTKGYRNISQSEFEKVKFISLASEETEIKDYKLNKKNNGLVLSWDYPATVDQATFTINYLAIGGLRSSKQRNIISWTPIKDGWQVPIKDIDVKFNLPDQVANIKAAPEADIEQVENSILTFHRPSLAAGTNYSLTVSFPEIISAPELLEIKFIYILVGVLIGLGYAILEFIIEWRKTPGEVEFSGELADFSFSELGSILYPSSQQKRVGVAAEIFSLAQKGKIKLISQVQEKLFGGKKADIRVQVVSKENLNKQQQLLISHLQAKETLKKVVQEVHIFNQLEELAEDNLLEQGFLNEPQMNKKQGLVRLGLSLLLGGILLAAIGIVTRIAVNSTISSGLLMVIIGIEKLIKTEAVSLLSPAGVGLQTEVKSIVEKKQQLLEQKIVQDPADGLEFFFAELPFILLHQDYDRSKLNEYKQQFKEVEKVVIPDWIEFDLSGLEVTLEELEVTEIIDQMVASTIYVAAVSGATGAEVAG